MTELMFPAIVNGDASTTINSTPIVAQNLFAASVQVVTVGTTTGTIKVQASNDPCGNPNSAPAPTHWADITQSVSYTTANTYLIVKFDVCYNWIRVVNTAGTGAGTVSVNVKALGA